MVWKGFTTRIDNKSGRVSSSSPSSSNNTDAEQGTASAIYTTSVSNLRDFCYKIMTFKPEVSILALSPKLSPDVIQHPEIARLTMHIVVNVLIKTLQGQPELVVKVLDYCLSLQYTDNSSNRDYSAAVKSFQGARLSEIQRVAMSFPDYLRVRTSGISHLSCRLLTCYRMFMPT